MSPPRDKTAYQTSPCKCKICISSIESDVYNKKKIQMFVVNMTFISSSEVKKCIFHSCLWHSWNIHFFTSLDEISHIHSKHLNILYISPGTSSIMPSGYLVFIILFIYLSVLMHPNVLSSIRMFCSFICPYISCVKLVCFAYNSCLHQMCPNT